MKFGMGGLCPVCGDTVTGVHYGVPTCESCKLFFRRAVRCGKHTTFKCANRLGCCPIGLHNRIVCKYCRYVKCLRTEGLVPQYSWSRAGNAIILLGEYRFKKRSRHVNQKQEIHWVCNKCDKGCKAKLTTLNDAIIKIYNVHDHDGMRKAK
ncbi:unnamed protein product, partial [Iphiclides podalirius]